MRSEDARAMVARHMAAAGPIAPASSRPVGEAHLAGLPEPAQRFLRFMGVLGRPRDWSFRAEFQGRFRTAPGRRWMPCHAWQYNCASPVARVFVMRLRAGGVIPVTGTDTYLAGRGRMHGEIPGGVTVLDAAGPELDTGELATWVNDAMMVAPSMLLPPRAEWSGADGCSFNLRVADGASRVEARVVVDDGGRMVEFRTSDRWYAARGGPVRAGWVTPVAGWTMAGDRPLPATAAAVWELPAGDFRYVEGAWVPGSVEHNVLPGDPGAPRTRRLPTQIAAGLARSVIGA